MRHISFILPPGDIAASLRGELQAWDSPTTLVLLIGDPGAVPPAQALSEAMPTSVLIGASSNGTLLGATIPPPDHFTLTVMKFTASRFLLEIAEEIDEGKLGGKLGAAMSSHPLNGIFLMAVGGATLADLLIRALSSHTQVPIAGGLAATTHSGEGWVMAGSRIIRKGALALGYMGQASFNSAVAAGWEKDTSVQGMKASGVKTNTIKFLNGLPAIAAITRALGLGPSQLAELKRGELNFPFAVGMHGKSLVLKGFDEKTGEVVFTGDMDHSGQQIALLKAHPAKLVRATFRAAEAVCKDSIPGVVLFMVCNARRQSLGDKHVTELGAVAINMHQDSDLIGWYSWGEVAIDELGSRLQNLRGIVMNITEPEPKLDQ